MEPIKKGRPAPPGDGPTYQEQSIRGTTNDDHRQCSRQVAWYEVHLWRDRMLKHFCVQTFPMAGTPTWCALPDDDPVKLAAALDAASHWALRLDTCQEASSRASQTISAALDWAAEARIQQQHAEFYADKPYLRRVVA